MDKVVLDTDYVFMYVFWENPLVSSYNRVVFDLIVSRHKYIITILSVTQCSRNEILWRTDNISLIYLFLSSLSTLLIQKNMWPLMILSGLWRYLWQNGLFAFSWRLYWNKTPCKPKTSVTNQGPHSVSIWLVRHTVV
jgi:formate hydrogenlyase subunit 3/multisubunit Na+/H+ antiporter MnhD subunit